MISPDASVLAYLMQDGLRSSDYPVYAGMAEADPSVALVPFKVKPCRLESAVGNLRNGMLSGIMLDSTVAYDVPDDLVDVRTPVSALAGHSDLLYYDGKSRLVVGDLAGARAFQAVAGLLQSDKIEDPIALVYGDYDDKLVAMSALSGQLTFVTVCGRDEPPFNEIDMGCRVEFMGDPDPRPFDILVNPPKTYTPTGSQIVVDTKGPDMTAYRLAETICACRGFDGGMVRGMADAFLQKNRALL